MDHDLDLHRDTLAVSLGRPTRTPGAPLNVSPVLASTYVGAHDTTTALGYGRDGNETWSALEEVLGTLEGGRCVTFASGMAAASAVLDLLAPGDTVVLPTSCYLGVSALVRSRAEKFGWVLREVDVADTEAVLAAADGADLVWLESPTNPLMEVADLPGIGAALRGRVRTVVDNTFASALLQRPLEHGFDVVLESGTKFVGGHSDLLLGALSVRTDGDGADELFAALAAVRHDSGAVPGPMETWLALRGIRTMPLRVRAAVANAGVLAERLAAHPAVRRVRYPGLPSDEGHARAAATMDGFGSLLSVELADGPTAERFVDGCTLWTHATSLGSVESTFERRRRWSGELDVVPEGLVRMSVGVEHADDLWADLERSLDAL
ncbi:cystathionine gamma-synthase [Microlunatus sagamiharensis]|uniref:Cystathionine gamma-synthase n=1 Tax=Microlunatus sagamiharensis TaxID=546874 RepID=A0A1H2LZU9_9ACTN|nr:PLP-dependent transferase [Microlunatus sagamiharensis]SDU85806.1 cystathionine gamma-synthase [Microlunatus sagamiharensis]